MSRHVSKREQRFSRAAVIAVLGLLGSLVTAAGASAEATEDQLSVSVQADDGRGRAVDPGRACQAGPNGGTGAYWHYQYGDDLSPGVFSSLAGEALVHLDLHSDPRDFQNVDGVYDDGENPRAFLGGSESRVSLLNDRGSVKLQLTSGSCEAPTLAFDGSIATGGGQWEVRSGTGAYRDAAGSGTFAMTAEVNPGADNALDLDLDGSISVPTPALEVSVAKTFWGGLGSDYLTRRVSVVYRIANVGPGDAFGVVVTGIETPPESGARPMLGANYSAPLGDLPACLPDGSNQDRCTATVTIRHQLLLQPGPCELVILGCEFDSTITADLPDALDRPNVQSDSTRVRAPDTPPPL